MTPKVYVTRHCHTCHHVMRHINVQYIFFLQEKAAWSQLNGMSIEELKRQSLESLDGTKKKKSGGLSGVSFRMGR